jgi:formylglycine-generating enzyme required for sulfatase activity
MTVEIDQVRQILAAFHQNDRTWRTKVSESHGAGSAADQQLRATLNQIEQTRAQKSAIPQQIGDELAAMDTFLASYAITAPAVTPAPVPDGIAGSALLAQHTTAARTALAELHRWQRTVPQLIHVPAGAVKRRLPKLFTIDVEVQQLPEFWIGVTPVTNRQYSEFFEAQAGRIAAPLYWPGGRYPAGADERPVTGVTYEHACDYCRWAGLQLASAAQWLRAARGDSLDHTPWGDRLPGEPYGQSGRNVGAVAGDRSQFGVRDMLGLTAQWLATPHARTPQRAGTATTLDEIATDGGPYAGLRVVRSTSDAALASPQRSTGLIRSGRVLALMLLLACIGGGSWLGVSSLMRQATAQALARSQLDLVSVPAGGGVAAYRVTRTEVTNAEYAQCVAAGACTLPRNTTNYDVPAYARHPVVYVTRAQAQTYAAWVGGSLPTEAQWARACQGDDGRTYPWGEAAPDERLANFNYDGRQDYDTTPVGSYPAGASPYGALDMAGNVWEWVEADDGDDPRYIIRGGAFGSSAGNVVCGARLESVNVIGNDNVGFRVVSPGR